MNLTIKFGDSRVGNELVVLDKLSAGLRKAIQLPLPADLCIGRLSIGYAARFRLTRHLRSSPYRKLKL